MPTPELVEKVRRLHQELGETQPSPSTRPQLDQLKQHVETVLREPTHAPHYTSLRDRLTAAYVAFEIDHPKLATTMQGVMSELDAAGL